MYQILHLCGILNFDINPMKYIHNFPHFIYHKTKALRVSSFPKVSEIRDVEARIQIQIDFYAKTSALIHCTI